MIETDNNLLPQPWLLTMQRRYPLQATSWCLLPHSFKARQPEIKYDIFHLVWSSLFCQYMQKVLSKFIERVNFIKTSY